MKINRVAALRDERTALLTLCESFTEEHWRAPSRATGWTVQDVLAHMGSGCHAMFTAAAPRMLFSRDIESTNDEMVDVRRGWSPAQVLDEYRIWSARVIQVAGALSRTPMAFVPIRLAELGRFPLRILPAGALTFDHHAHLRHDILPALDLPDPGTDANRMDVVIEWMLAVLSNQIRTSAPWMDKPVTLTLRGIGGGVWTVRPCGTIVRGNGHAEVIVEATAIEFPEWGTTRVPWRERDVSIIGDHDYGSRFLDQLNVV
ncbi:maleylpyruvate isomerase family mycothiol-dependent enzyme [Mycolicibacterium sp. Y3]